MVRFVGEKHFCWYGGRIPAGIRKALEEMGLFVYSIRDRYPQESLEKYVLVNHLDDIVANFKIEDYFKNEEDYWQDRLEMLDWYDKLFQFCDLDNEHKFEKFVCKTIKKLEEE